MVDSSMALHLEWVMVVGGGPMLAESSRLQTPAPSLIQ